MKNRLLKKLTLAMILGSSSLSIESVKAQPRPWYCPSDEQVEGFVKTVIPDPNNITWADIEESKRHLPNSVSEPPAWKLVWFTAGKNNDPTSNIKVRFHQQIQTSTPLCGYNILYTKKLNRSGKRKEMTLGFMPLMPEKGLKSKKDVSPLSNFYKD